MICKAGVRSGRLYKTYSKIYLLWYRQANLYFCCSFFDFLTIAILVVNSFSKYFKYFTMQIEKILVCNERPTLSRVYAINTFYNVKNMH